MVGDPTLYNIVNAITFGSLDTIKGALFPEEPWSLEHWLDIVGAILSVYVACRIALGVKSILTRHGDNALRAGSALSDSTDDIVRNAGLTRTQISDIINTPKGQRPDPSTYLTQEYVDQHLDMFRSGATKIYAKSPTGTVGSPSGTFVMPSSVADDLIKQANGDVRVLEDLLGLDPGDLGAAPVRIDVSSPRGLRIPSGNEHGANNYWLPGGYTSGGIPEAVIDRVPPGEYVVTPIK